MFLVGTQILRRGSARLEMAAQLVEFAQAETGTPGLLQKINSFHVSAPHA